MFPAFSVYFIVFSLFFVRIEKVHSYNNQDLNVPYCNRRRVTLLEATFYIFVTIFSPRFFGKFQSGSSNKVLHLGLQSQNYYRCNLSSSDPLVQHIFSTIHFEFCLSCAIQMLSIKTKASTYQSFFMIFVPLGVVFLFKLNFTWYFNSGTFHIGKSSLCLIFPADHQPQ